MAYFLCFCPLSLAAKLNFNISKVVYWAITAHAFSHVNSSRSRQKIKQVMETRKDVKDTDGFDWLESTELPIDKRKFLLNRMFVEQPIPQDDD